MIKNSIARKAVALSILLATGALISAPAVAVNSRFEIGIRAETNIGPGVPSNDMVGFSLTGRYRLNDRWLLGFAIENSPVFDVEDPFKEVGISAETNDAEATSTMLSAWAERRYRSASGRRYLFWTGGVGVNTVDVDDLTGTDDNGTPYTLSIDVDTEIAITAVLGQRHLIGQSMSFGYGARLEQRMADWTVVHRESNTTGTIDDYFVNGVFLDFNYHF